MDGYHSYALRKLVRNSSLENMGSKGAKVEWRRLDAAEKRAELLVKLGEEVEEARQAKGVEFVEELADLVEIVKALAEIEGVDMAGLEALRLEKLAKRGDFSEGYYVEVIHCPVGSYWDEYCGRDAVKYPRV